MTSDSLSGQGFDPSKAQVEEYDAIGRKELKNLSKEETWADAAKVISALTELKEQLEESQRQAVDDVIGAIREGRQLVKGTPLEVFLYDPITFKPQSDSSSDFTHVTTEEESCDNGTRGSLATFCRSIFGTVRAGKDKVPVRAIKSGVQGLSNDLAGRVRAGHQQVNLNRGLAAAILAALTHSGDPPTGSAALNDDGYSEEFFTISNPCSYPGTEPSSLLQDPNGNDA